MTVRLEKSVKRFLADREGERLPSVGDQIYREDNTPYILTDADLPVGSTVKYADTGRVATYAVGGWSGPVDDCPDPRPLLERQLGVQTESRDLLLNILARLSS